MMTIEELSRKCKERAEYKAIAEQAKAACDELEAEIKAEMLERGVESLNADGFMVYYRPNGTKSVFDSKAFKADFPDVYDEYKHEVPNPYFRIK